MRSLRCGVPLMAVAGLLACDIPTDAPMVEQRWIIPMDETRIPVAQFLPDGVVLAGDLFAITLDPFTAEASLGELCASCVNGSGTAPAFAATFSASEPFPDDVLAAVLESGSVTVAVQNGFSFDPTAGGGSVVITLTDVPDGKVLGQATISTAMAPGSTVARGITLGGGGVEPNLTISVVVTSPGGQSATLDTDAKLTASVEPVAILASFATVNVASRSVDLDPVDLDVADIDDTILDHLQSGGMKLDINNPFGVAMTATVVITYPGGTLTRTVEIEGAVVSTASVTYTGDEFRSFLGKEGVTLTGTGSVSSLAGPITVRTDLQLVLDATIDLTLVVG